MIVKPKKRNDLKIFEKTMKKQLFCGKSAKVWGVFEIFYVILRRKSKNRYV